MVPQAALYRSGATQKVSHLKCRHSQWEVFNECREKAEFLGEFYSGDRRKEKNKNKILL